MGCRSASRFCRPKSHPRSCHFIYFKISGKNPTALFCFFPFIIIAQHHNGSCNRRSGIPGSCFPKTAVTIHAKAFQKAAMIRVIKRIEPMILPPGICLRIQNILYILRCSKCVTGKSSCMTVTIWEKRSNRKADKERVPCFFRF